MEEFEIIEEVYKIAKPLVDPIIQTLVKPKLAKLSSWLKKNESKLEVQAHAWENKFEDYLLRTYQNAFYIPTIVFPNQQIKLSSIYYPVELVNTKNYSKTKSDSIDLEFFSTNKRILVSDYAGMGKSTFSRFITSHVITEQLGIPIFIELKSLNKGNPILKEIYEQLNPIGDQLNEDFVIQLLKRGDFIIILDGFDEVAIANQEVVIKDIRRFISHAPNCNYILTSRPETSLASFGEFQNFYISPLKLMESFSIIDKLDKISELGIYNKLKSDIEDKLTSIEEFLTNPFLVSLLYKSYSYNKDIPSKRSTFYEEVYSALYKAHDLSKEGFKRGKKSMLDIQDFRTVLRELAFESAKLRQVDYTKQELIESIKTASSKCTDLSFKPIDFFDDLLLTVPLFLKDGAKFKWAHKSIQDYFAAEFICYDRRKIEICNRIYKSENEAFLNVLVLLQEMEPRLFKSTILKKLLEDFINFYETSYTDFDSAKKIDIRKSLTFGKRHFFMLMKSTIVENRHQEALKILFKHFKAEKSNSFSTSISYYGGNGESMFVRFHSSNFQRRLLEQIHQNCKFDVFVPEENLIRRSNLNEIELPELNKPYMLDDRQKNILNDADNFNSVTIELIWLNEKRFRRKAKQKGMMSSALKYSASKILIEEIQKEQKEADSRDILEGL